MSEVLSAAEIEDRLPRRWEHDGDEIVRTYEFTDYLHGVNFAHMVGEIAQAQFHHPEIVIRFKEVEIRLTTHDADGVTDADIQMAEFVESERTVRLEGD